LAFDLIPQPYLFASALLLLIGGFIAWSAGYRLFRFVLTLFGFFFGAAIASQMSGPSDTSLAIFLALGGGAVGALIMFLGYFVGVALVGAGIGALIAHVIWSRIGTDPHPFVVVLASVAGAASAMTLQRYVIIVATAFAGAWSSLIGAFLLVNRNTPAAERATYVLYPFDLLQRPQWVQLLWVGLGFLGVFVQMRFTGGRKK
jgi:hypothetical protein